VFRYPEGHSPKWWRNHPDKLAQAREAQANKSETEPKPPHAIPISESTFLWSCIGIFITFISLFLAVVMKDPRWYLLMALPWGVLAIWKVCSYFVESAPNKWALTIFSSLILASILFRVSKVEALKPDKSDAATHPSDKQSDPPTSSFPNQDPVIKPQMQTKKTIPPKDMPLPTLPATLVPEASKTEEPQRKENSTFRDDPDYFIVAAAGNSMNVGPQNNSSTPQHIARLDELYVDAFVDNGQLKLNIGLQMGGVWGSPVSLQANTLKMEQPDWDRNYDDSAVEVIDDHQIVRLQVIYITPHSVEVYGVFATVRGDLMLLTPNGFTPLILNGPTTMKQIQDALKSVPGFPLKPIFKYPSRYNLHKRNE